MFSYAVSLSCVPLVIIILLFCVMMESCFSGSVIKTFRRFSLSVLRTLAFVCVCVCVHNLRLQFVFVRRSKEIEDRTHFWLSIDCGKSIVENKSSARIALSCDFRGDNVFLTKPRRTVGTTLFSPLNCIKLSIFSWPCLLHFFAFFSLFKLLESRVLRG